MIIDRECGNTDLHRYPAVIFIVDLLLDDLKKNSPLYHEVANIVYDDLDLDQFKIHMKKLLKIYGYSEYLIRLCDYYRLKEIYANERLKDNLRGALLERFTCKLLEKNYEKDDKEHIRCFICFPTLSEKRSLKEVDVFFYVADDEIGESIECKIKPFRLEKEHIINLKDIFVKSNEKILPSIVSFSSKRELELRIKDLEEQLGHIKLYGFDNLKDIVERNKMIK